MANKRIIELQERTSIDMGDWLIVDSSTSTRKLSLATLFNYMTYSSMIFVTELPTTDISTTTIYLVPHSGSTTDWDEYIYRENEWVLIGTSTIDLSAIYQTKTDNNLQTASKQIVGAINEVKSALSQKSTVRYSEFTINLTSQYLGMYYGDTPILYPDGDTSYHLVGLLCMTFTDNAPVETQLAGNNIRAYSAYSGVCSVRGVFVK